MKVFLSLIFSLLLTLSCISESFHGHFGVESVEENHCLICKKLTSDREIEPSHVSHLKNQRSFSYEFTFEKSHQTTYLSEYLYKVRSRAPPIV